MRWAIFFCSDSEANSFPQANTLQSTLQSDQLNIAVLFWYLVKRDLSSVRYCTEAYTIITFYKASEQHCHVYLAIIALTKFPLFLESCWLISPVKCIHEIDRFLSNQCIILPCPRFLKSSRFCDYNRRYLCRL